jgi:ABC-2 type transport system permease protein
MRGSVVGQLIWKDWRLQRDQIFFTIAAGALALAIVQWGGQSPIVVGGVFFFVALILVGHMLPFAGIVNERKKQYLAFLMSLPISSIQYTTAKLISSLVMFLIPWLTLVIAAMLLVATRGILPHGAIPLLLILALLPFLGFCLITGVVLVSESEGWGIAANVFCSSTYGLVWYFMTQIPMLIEPAKGASPVWNAAALKMLAIEVALIPLMLGLTYFLQSRKRDFV